MNFILIFEDILVFLKQNFNVKNISKNPFYLNNYYFINEPTLLFENIIFVKFYKILFNESCDIFKDIYYNIIIMKL